MAAKNSANGLLTHLVIGLGKLLAMLPIPVLLFLGKGLGYLFWWFAHDRRHITLTNLRLCFPDKTEQEIQALAKDSIINMGLAFTEMMQAYWGNPEKVLPYGTIEGMEHIQAAQLKERGVLLVGIHFSSIDICGQLLAKNLSVDSVYRPHNNPVLDQAILEGRQRYAKNCIKRSDIRSMIRQLKNQRIVWYAPDQDFGRKVSVFAPFFGVPTATLTITARLAKATNCMVIPVIHCRTQDNKGYLVRFLPPLENYPSGDDVTDATTLNKTIEQMIMQKPADYMWVHRRFKTRPEGSPSVY